MKDACVILVWLQRKLLNSFWKFWNWCFFFVVHLSGQRITLVDSCLPWHFSDQVILQRSVRASIGFVEFSCFMILQLQNYKAVRIMYLLYENPIVGNSFAAGGERNE